ncbi:P-loop containing nucleoside triphosphate hydrolase protein [Diplocarpon rosae]|nr:P-loop containing nucleoside triphosphate hydrolase protein [Diplocarpon rosae]
MALDKDEWEIGMKRFQEAARKVRADCQVLLTKNVGGEEEAESAANEKDKDCSGKVLPPSKRSSRQG